jgi:hypothetical protein
MQHHFHAQFPLPRTKWDKAKLTNESPSAELMGIVADSGAA